MSLQKPKMRRVPMMGASTTPIAAPKPSLMPVTIAIVGQATNMTREAKNLPKRENLISSSSLPLKGKCFSRNLIILRMF